MWFPLPDIFSRSWTAAAQGLSFISAVIRGLPWREREVRPVYLSANVRVHLDVQTDTCIRIHFSERQ
jgi:hypothetical protein